MKSDIDIKELWRKQAVPFADCSGLFKEVNHFKRKKVLELIVLNAVLWMTICFVAFVWIYFKPQLLVTKIGILLTIVAMGTVAVFTHKMIPLYRIVDEEQSNREYLNELLAVRRKENFMQTKLMNFYFISLSVGIGLYMYEHIQESSLQFRVVAYSVFLLWVGLNWFVFRPRIIRRNRRQVQTKNRCVCRNQRKSPRFSMIMSSNRTTPKRHWLLRYTITTNVSPRP